MGDNHKEHLSTLPDYGKLFPIDEWLNAVATGAFIPYDGDGYWATIDGMDKASDVWGSNKPDWATHVMWFNR